MCSSSGMARQCSPICRQVLESVPLSFTTTQMLGCSVLFRTRSSTKLIGSDTALHLENNFSKNCSLKCKAIILMLENHSSNRGRVLLVSAYSVQMKASCV